MIQTQQTDPGYGTLMAVDSIIQTIEQSREPYDTLVVNLATLLRNRNRKTATIASLIKEMKDDVEMISLRVSSAFNNRLKSDSAIVFYIEDCLAILPPENARGIPLSKAIFMGSWATLFKHFSEHKNRHHNTLILSRKLKTRKDLYAGIVEEIQHLKTTQSTIMLSHLRMDYHISMHFPKMIIVDSFTGTITTTKEISEKCFGTSAIPFYPETHILFGDNDMVKPKLELAERRAVIEIAERDHWRMLSRDEIRKRLISMKLLKPGERWPLT